MEKEIEEMRKNERIAEQNANEEHEYDDDNTEEHEKLKYKGIFGLSFSKGLYLVITLKLIISISVKSGEFHVKSTGFCADFMRISQNLVDFMKSGRFHVKST